MFSLLLNIFSGYELSSDNVYLKAERKCDDIWPFPGYGKERSAI